MTIDARPRPGSIAKVTAFAALALALIALIVITMRRADEPRATDPSEARAPAVATPRFDKPIPAQRQAAGTATYIQVVDAEGRPVPHAGMWEGAADARFSADDPIATGDQRGLLIAPENAAQTGKGRWIWRHGYL
ncbi:MAG: hypothetical protein KAI24_01515, partial [Planctomycetes bacterium]|nr:hypothetical protein [Planctomycetota bacterium]